jgi:predicted ATPase/DNA-binding SARP family transcriptional activator
MTLPDPLLSPLFLRLFGPFEAMCHGEPLPGVRVRRGHWLLALLVLRHGREVERSWLAGTLWPESGEAQAFSSLRSMIAAVRQALGLNACRLRSPTPATLCLDLSGMEVDLLAFDAAVAQGDEAALSRAVALYRGPLLEGCAEEWIFQDRQAREQAYLHALETLAAAALARGELETAERQLRQAAVTDPLRESTQRTLMQTLAAGGNYAAALLTYRELRLRLHRELNAEPDPETQALFQQIRTEARSKSALGAPVAATLEPGPNNLPVQPTPLVGRERELATVQQFLLREEARLVTLTGPAGVGKTRLGLQVAAELLDAFPDGVYFVALAPIRDAGLILTAIAQVLEVRPSGSQPLLECLKAELRSKTLLLLLDNFEHVLEAAPEVAALLSGCPGLKVLATSRAPLHLSGEQEFPVPPLALPDRKRLPSTQALPRYAAVQLFIQRALAVKPEFAVTDESGPAVAEICHRLDGLPLAIELAAARIKLLSPQSLLTRLSNRLKLLTGGARDVPARHRTLREAIAWSYDLLSEEEQRLFRRLSIFAGGCTLEAVEAVCRTDGEREMEALDGMASLIDKSLVQQVDGPSGEPRYHLLETLREYGQERLAESGEAEATRQQHARFFLELSDRIRPELNGPMQGQWLARLQADHDNLRAAIDYCLASGEAETGLLLCSSLQPFWQVRGFLTEGRERLHQVLALPGAQEPTLTRARALGAAGGLAMEQGDYEAARALLEESLAFRSERGDRSGVAWDLNTLGGVALRQGNYSLARERFEECLAIWRDLGELGLADDLNNLANVVFAQGEYDEAEAMYEQSLASARKGGNRQHVAGVSLNLGIVALAKGEYERASALLEECLAIHREQGNRQPMPDPLNKLGTVALRQGDYEAARARFEESLTICHEVGDKPRLAQTLEGLASLAGTRSRPARAARLFGAAATLRETIGAPVHPAHRPALEQRVTETRAILGEEAFTAGWAAGRALTLDEAVAEALRDDDRSSRESDSPERRSG